MLNARDSERGSALMISLGVLVLLALMGTVFVMQARLESRVALATSNLAQVEQLTLQRFNTLMRTQGAGTPYSGAAIQKGDPAYNVNYVDNDNSGYADSNWTGAAKLSEYQLGAADTVSRYVRYAILKKVVSQNLIDVNSHSPAAIERALAAANLGKAQEVADNIVFVAVDAKYEDRTQYDLVTRYARYGKDEEPGNPTVREFRPLFPLTDDRPFGVTTLVDVLVNPADSRSRLEQIFDNNNILPDFEPHRQLFTSYSVTKVTPEGEPGLEQVNIDDLVRWIGWGSNDGILGTVVDFTVSYPKDYQDTDFSIAVADASLDDVARRILAGRALLKFRDTMGQALGETGNRGTPDDLARANQIAVNLKDFLDADSDITRLTVATATHYYGIEKHPYINEAWIWDWGNDGLDNDDDGLTDEDESADPTSPEKTDEDTYRYYFVELYNPWNVPINLGNWKIGGDSGATAGSMSGSIPAGAYLVVSNMSDPDPLSAPNWMEVSTLEFDYAVGSAYNQGDEINLYWEDTYTGAPADPYVLADRFLFPIQVPGSAALLGSAERYVFMVDHSAERTSGAKTSMRLEPDATDLDQLASTLVGYENGNFRASDVVDLLIADVPTYAFLNVGDLSRIMEVGYTEGDLAYTQLGHDSMNNDGDAETDEPDELWNNYRLNEGLNATSDIDGQANRRRVCTLASDTRGVYEYFTTRPSFPNAQGEPGYTYGYVDICPPYNSEDRPVFCGVTNIVENNAVVGGSTYLEVDDLIDYGSGNTAGDVLTQVFADSNVINTYEPQIWGALRVLAFGVDGNNNDKTEDMFHTDLTDEKDEKEFAIGALLNEVSGRPLDDAAGRPMGVVAYIITCQIDNGADLDSGDLVVYGQKRLLAVVDYTTSPVSIVCQKWLAPLR